MIFCDVCEPHGFRLTGIKVCHRFGAKVKTTQIKSLPEAQEELKRIASWASQIVSSVERVKEFEQGLIVMLGLNGAPARDHMVQTPNGHNGHCDVGITVVDRVISILREKGPIKLGKIVEEYSARKWPEPKSGTVYNSIANTVNYLYRKKRVTRNRRGYLVSTQTLPVVRESLKVEEGVRA